MAVPELKQDPNILREVMPSDTMGGYFNYAYNIPNFASDDPSSIWEQLRWNPWLSMAAYEDMELKDAAIASALATRKDGVLAKARSVLPASNMQADARVANFVDEMLNSFFDSGVQSAGGYFGFDNFLLEALDAVGKGVSVGEIIWADGGDSIFIRDVRFKPQHLFSFGDTGAASYSASTFLYPQTGALKLRDGIGGVGLASNQALPEAKFFVHSYRPRYSNRWGSPLLREVFWASWFKRAAAKQWLRYLEKGSGSVVARYHDGASESEQSRALDAALAVNEESAVALPSKFQLEVLEHVRNIGDAHKAFVSDFCDAEIARVILGQTLTSRGSEGGGSRALGEVHNEVRGEKIEADAKSLMMAVNTRLVFPLVMLNFGAVKRPPVWTIKYNPQQDLSATSVWLARLWEMGLPVKKSYIYNTFQLPEVAAEDEDILPPPSESSKDLSLPASGVDSASFAESKKKDTERQVREQVELEDGTLSQVAPIYDGLMRDFIERLESLDEIRDATQDRFYARFETAFNQLSELLADGLLAAYLLALYQQQSAKVAEFAEFSTGFELPPKEAIEFFRDKKVMTRRDFDRKDAESRRAAFTVSGINKLDTIESFKSEIATALSDGKTQQQTVKRFKEILAGAGHKQLGDFHLETVYRTNMQTAYGVGKRKALSESATLLPFWTYSAVLDDRTRPHHAALDGVTLPADHPFWDENFPPRGFNCRCTVFASATMPDDYNYENPSGQAEITYDADGKPAKAEIGTTVIDLQVEKFPGVPKRGDLQEVLTIRATEAAARKLPTPQAVLDHEAKIRFDQRETLSFFDHDGKLLYRKIGEPDQVEFGTTDYEEKLLKGSVMTHNHRTNTEVSQDDPGWKGKSFSIDDVQVAAEIEIAELRSVSFAYRHSMRPPIGGWNKALGEEIALAFEINYAKVYARLEMSYLRDEISYLELDMEATHEAWRLTAQQYKLKYKREER